MDIDVRSRMRRRAGQAMTEFAIGLFAAVLLFSGLFAAAGIMRDLLEARSRLRAEAGEKALQSTAGTAPRNIARWDEGPDGLQYTPDDRAQSGISYAIAAIAGHAEGPPGTAGYALAHDALPSSMLDVARGIPYDSTFAEKHETVENDVPPFAAEYLFGSERVRNKVKVAIPAAGGLL